MTLNVVMSIQRNRNLAQGMPGSPWVDTTLDEVKRQIQSKGL